MDKKLLLGFIRNAKPEEMYAFSRVVVDMLSEEQLMELEQHFEVALRMKVRAKKSLKSAETKPEVKPIDETTVFQETPEELEQEFELRKATGKDGG